MSAPDPSSTTPARAAHGRGGFRIASWFWLLLCIPACIGFVWLGNWQVERMFWKRDLIARVDARAHADPVPAPAAADWSSVTRDADEYRRVSLTGEFVPGQDALVQAVTELGGGFWVMTPLQRDDGTVVWINRGYVPQNLSTPESRTPLRTGPVEITGLLRLTEPDGGFLRDNDPTGNRWFSRDVVALSQQAGLTAAPYFIDAQVIAAAPPTAHEPVPGLTVLTFTDNHLVYALTWYGMALLSAIGLSLVLREERRRARARRS